MNTVLDLENWERKEHFEFFNQFDEPFFGVTIDLDCSKAYTYCKSKGHSFFLYYLHKSLKAANEIEAFRYRIVDDQVIVFNTVNASPTIGRPNGTFGFSFMEYFESYADFERAAKKVIEKVVNGHGLMMPKVDANIIHYSSVPWIKFTSMSHARSFSFQDSCPKISFGKMHEKNGIKQMPISIHVHHALMDAYHVGKFISRFQDLMNQ